MAINGNLKDISFVELLKLIGRRTGRLCVFDFAGKRQYEWFFADNALRAARINQQPLRDEAAVLAAALQIAHDSTSSYIFYKQESADRFPQHLAVPINELMAKALNSLSAANSPAYAQHFPHDDTKFEAVTNAENALVDESLRFWIAHNDLLRAGASAVDIAGSAQISVAEARVELYKLKLLGAARPVRAFGESTASAPVAQNFNQNSGATAANQKAAQNFAPNQTDFLKTPERRNLVSRMLGALFGKPKTV